MFEDVKPTRSELLRLRKRRELSEKGHDLLKKKRDGLVLEFFEVLEQAGKLRQQLNDKHAEAEKALSFALAMEGSVGVRSAAVAVARESFVDIRADNVMGVIVPRVSFPHMSRHIEDRGYGITTTSIYIEDTAKSYEELLGLVARAAELETALKRLLVEIEKVKKRINALEQKIIPGLDAAERGIALRLEELERESIFRLKRIKGKTKKAEAA